MRRREFIAGLAGMAAGGVIATSAAVAVTRFGFHEGWRYLELPAPRDELTYDALERTVAELKNGTVWYFKEPLTNEEITWLYGQGGGKTLEELYL